MLIVELNGGLGNQMFQYALYRKLISIGKDAYLYDAVLTDSLNNIFCPKIFEVFSLEYSLCDRHACYARADVRRDMLNAWRRRVFGKRKLKTNFVETNFDDNYDFTIYDLEDAYIQGYWQSELYFKDIEDRIRDDFFFTKIDACEVEDILDNIYNSNSVSIHVRRGDYINISAFCGICTEEYYRRAISRIYEKIKDPYFFVFSDDLTYVRSFFQGENFCLIDKFQDEKAYYDMFLMSKCKHNIVANSSFSWWGAWLNSNKEKIVIAPKHWKNDHEMRHTPCKEWIKI